MEPSAGHEPEVGVLVAQAGVIGGDDHVAGEGELQSPGEGESLDDGDDGDGQFLKLEEAAVEDLDVVVEEGRLVEGGVEVEEVGPGAESPPLAPDNEGLDGLVSGQAVGCARKFFQQFQAEGVEGVGTVEGDGGDGVGAGQADVAVLQGGPPMVIQGSNRREENGGLQYTKWMVKYGRAGKTDSAPEVPPV